MFKAKNTLLTSLAAILLASLLGKQAITPAVAQQADELLLECSQQLEETSNQLNCDFRSKKPAQPEELSLTINGQTVEPVRFTPFLTGEKRSAWLYLIDKSNPGRATTVARNVDIARTQLRNASLRRLIGVATFASNLEVVLEPAAAHDNFDKRLDAIKADGLATEYFANALAAVKILQKVQADRKALVIMSDGKAEDTAYQREDVVQAAKKAGVTIFGLGFAEKETDTPFLQKVRRLAEETDGQFVSVVGSESISSRFLTDLTRNIENGGAIEVDLPADTSGPIDVKLNVRTADGALLAGGQTLELSPVAAPVQQTPEAIPLIGQIYSGLSEGMGHWVSDNQLSAWLVLLLLPAFAIAAFVFFGRSKKPDETPVPTHVEPIEEPVTGLLPIEPVQPDPVQEEDGPTRKIDVDPEPIQLGYFEVVGNEDKRYIITLKSMSIGRHSDNDMQLSNDTVHRHHAHFFISPDGEATIKDLDTTNGVYLNGERINSATLTSGSMIELGEVRLRYVSTQ